MSVLIIIQRLKVLAKERQNVIIKNIKESDGAIKMIESTSSQISRGCYSDIRSIKSEKSEERYKDKMDEVSKTIKEKEYLQKRTTELLEAIKKNQGENKGSSLMVNNPQIIHKGKFLLQEVKSDIES